jgi:hypothetical protein
MVLQGYDAPQKKISMKKMFLKPICVFEVNKVTCLLSLDISYGEKTIVENA